MVGWPKFADNKNIGLTSDYRLINTKLNKLVKILIENYTGLIPKRLYFFYKSSDHSFWNLRGTPHFHLKLIKVFTKRYTQPKMLLEIFVPNDVMNFIN